MTHVYVADEDTYRKARATTTPVGVLLFSAPGAVLHLHACPVRDFLETLQFQSSPTTN